MPLNVASIIGMAKDYAQQFRRASNWLTNSKSLVPPNTSPSAKNPSFIIKHCPRFEADQHICHLYVDGAWKEGSDWSDIGFTASHPNRIFIAK